MMPVHHFRVSPCVIIVKYGKCAANLMVSLCLHLELADVIANVSTLKYVITQVQVGLPPVPNCPGHPEILWVILICPVRETSASQLHLTPQAFVTPTRTGETCSDSSSCLDYRTG